MDKFLKLINGKKTLIVGILGAFTSYAIGKGYIGTEEAMLINALLGLLGYQASRMTKRSI